MKISLIKNIRQGAVLLCFALAFIACNSAKEESKKPNIIYILADDLGYGDVSAISPQSKITTPCMDALAAQSVVFTDAHTSSSVCTPTRYGILTGRYNWRSSLKKWTLHGYSKALIPEDRSTLASLLKSQNYETACIGKWHLGWDWANVDAGNDSIDYTKAIKNGPTKNGFDYFYGFNGSLDMPPYVWVENDQATMVPTKTIDRGDDKYAWFRKGICSEDFDLEQTLPQLADRAASYIADKAKKENPFFLYLPLPAPHLPILPTDEFKGISGLDSPYADFVLMVDWVVGQVTKALEQQGIADNTLIVFTSDNGCSPAANYEQLLSKEHNPSHLFRGWKADIYEGGHRVPFFVSWPKKIKPGISNALVSTTDFYATLADLFNIPMKDNEGEDSYSMLPVLGLESEAEQRTSMVQHSGHGLFAYRKGDWKVCFCPGSGGWSYPTPNEVKKMEVAPPKIQLFNLEEDISEQHNLEALHPEMVKDMHNELLQIIDKGRSTNGIVQQNDGEQEWKQLKSLREVLK
ncbi:MAG: arylsulfatase [Carboxylicivirga sp.]|jgi:arylsulfatase A-like enzyme|nr:arylsulfatase [Carboxylicivirga sp.]